MSKLRRHAFHYSIETSAQGTEWHEETTTTITEKKRKEKKPLVEKHRNQIFESLSVVTVNAKKVSRSYV
jgi:hypothetical protein